MEPVLPSLGPQPGNTVLDALLHFVRRVPHGHLAQSGEVGLVEEVVHGVLRLFGRIHDAALQAVNALPRTVVFLLWGAYAQKKIPLLTAPQHVILRSAHPSPYSAASGFFGSRPFSQTNTALEKAGEKAIDWQLPEIATE